MGMMGRDKFKESDMVRDKSWCIAKDKSVSAYSWESKRGGKSEKVDDRISVQYI